MNRTKNAKHTSLAQRLRKNMTDQERRLWYGYLKNLPFTVNRQKVIDPYIVDFYCAKAKLVIELDGSQHFEEKGQSDDRQRDAYLSELGLRVVRYSNLDVDRNFSAVCEDLQRRLADAFPAATSSTASGPPSPQGEG